MVATSLAVVVVVLRLFAGCSSSFPPSLPFLLLLLLGSIVFPVLLPRILRQISAPESHSRVISTLFSLSDLHSYSRTTIPQSVDTSWTPSLVPSRCPCLVDVVFFCSFILFFCCVFLLVVCVCFFLLLFFWGLRGRRRSQTNTVACCAVLLFVDCSSRSSGDAS
jgi:hypothetical protein